MITQYLITIWSLFAAKVLEVGSGVGVAGSTIPLSIAYYSLTISSLSTHYSLPVHSLLAHYLHVIRSLFARYPLSIHLLSVHYPLSIRSLLNLLFSFDTQCSLSPLAFRSLFATGVAISVLADTVTFTIGSLFNHHWLRDSLCSLFTH